MISLVELLMPSSVAASILTQDHLSLLDFLVRLRQSRQWLLLYHSVHLYNAQCMMSF